MADFAGFYGAAAGTCGALVGLLFVAVAISPEHMVGARADPLVRESAVGAFLLLANVLFISLAGLIPGLSLASVVLLASAAGILGTVTYALLSIPSLRAGGMAKGWSWVLRRAITLAVLAWQLLLAVDLWQNPRDPGVLMWLAVVSLLLMLVGLQRAWELLGGTRGRVLAAFRLWRTQQEDSGRRATGEETAVDTDH